MGTGSSDADDHPRTHVPGLRVRDLTPADEAAIASWSYTGADAVYDPGDGVSADRGFVALVDGDDELVGYACLGEEARVPDLAASRDVVDLGVGLRPDLVAGGWGLAVTEAVVGHARARAPAARHVRAVVLDWNARSRRTLRRAGFTETGEHVAEDGRVFVVAVRPLR